MDQPITHAYDEYRKAVEAEKSLASEIVGRTPTPEETEKFERMGADVATWKGEVDRLLDLDERSKAADEARVKIEHLIAATPVSSGESKTDGQRLANMFAEYRERGIATPFESHLSSRALASAGGSAIPVTFFDKVTVFQRTLSPMLNPDVVTILPVSDGRPITLPRLTADPNHGGTVTAEAAAINELDPTISSVQLNAYKYAVITLWSAELGQDNVIGLEDLIANATARELAIDVGAHLTTGDDSGKPNGFITAGANAGTATGTANNPFFGPADIVDLFYSRAAPYRQVGTWQASNTGLAKVRKLQDSTGQFLWQASLAPGQPESLLGRPIFENPAMAAVASASKSIAFGDFKAYWVQRVTPARVELSEHYKFSTDQLALKVVERIDGDLVDTVAVAYLVSAAA